MRKIVILTLIATALVAGGASTSAVRAQERFVVSWEPSDIGPATPGPTNPNGPRWAIEPR